jgi:hypothetical protein
MSCLEDPDEFLGRLNASRYKIFLERLVKISGTVTIKSGKRIKTKRRIT